MKTPKPSKSAERAQLAAEKAQAQAQEAANNLQKNFAADLNADNAAQVVASGTADAMDTGVGTSVKKKRPAGTVSSQLGIM